MDFIQIPKEFKTLTDLDFTERGLLAVYKYFTEKGHGCYIKNEEIYKEWLNVSISTFKRMKKKLKDLGYITIVGITTKYTGKGINLNPTTENSNEDNIKNDSDTGIKMNPKEYQNDTPTGIKMNPKEYQNDTPTGIKMIPHKEEKKKKEEFKEEKKEEKKEDERSSTLPEEPTKPIKTENSKMKQNIEIEEVINHLPCYYRTEELKPIIEKEFGDRIKNIKIDDPSDYGMCMNSIVSNIKNFLTTNYYQNIKTVIKKEPEKPKDNNDYDFDFGY